MKIKRLGILTAVVFAAGLSSCKCENTGPVDGNQPGNRIGTETHLRILIPPGRIPNSTVEASGGQCFPGVVPAIGPAEIGSAEVHVIGIDVVGKGNIETKTVGYQGKTGGNFDKARARLIEAAKIEIKNRPAHEVYNLTHLTGAGDLNNHKKYKRVERERKFVPGAGDYDMSLNPMTGNKEKLSLSAMINKPSRIVYVLLSDSLTFDGTMPLSITNGYKSESPFVALDASQKVLVIEYNPINSIPTGCRYGLNLHLLSSHKDQGKDVANPDDDFNVSTPIIIDPILQNTGGGGGHVP